MTCHSYISSQYYKNMKAIGIIFLLTFPVILSADSIPYPLHTGGGGSCKSSKNPVYTERAQISKEEALMWDVRQDSRCDQPTDNSYPCRMDFKYPPSGWCNTSFYKHRELITDIYVVLINANGDVLRRRPMAHPICEEGYILTQKGRVNATCVSGTCPSGTVRDETGNCLFHPRLQGVNLNKNGSDY